LLAESRVQEAQATLEEMQTNDPRAQLEIFYLLAWSATLTGQWDKTAAWLAATAQYGFQPGSMPPLAQTERRRRAPYLLILGNLGLELGARAEATRHYTQALACLNERRMNDQQVRIAVHCGLGRAYQQSGFFELALNHFTEALQLDDASHPLVGSIYYGLSATTARLGDSALATIYGHQALFEFQKYNNFSDEARTRALLGDIAWQQAQLDEAIKAYLAALELVQHDLVLSVMYQTTLARIHLEANQPATAWEWCQRAITIYTEIPDAFIKGQLAFLCGQVMEARYQQLSPESYLLDKANCWYTIAIELFSSIQAIQVQDELAAAYSYLAHLFEELDSPEKALECYKAAYTSLLPNNQNIPDSFLR
jgi:tetratricopeptide (TPR) repeat protein